MNPTNPNSPKIIGQQEATYLIQEKQPVLTFTKYIQHYTTANDLARRMNKVIDMETNKPVSHQLENLLPTYENPSKTSQGQIFPNKEIHHNHGNTVNHVENANHTLNQSKDFPLQNNLPAATGSTTRTTDIEEFLFSQRASFLEHQEQEDGISILKSKPSDFPSSISIGTHNIRG